MKSEDRRAQLLDVARQAFISRGYRNVTTSDVGAAVGVSDALVLKYFGNKETLFRAAVADPLLGLIESQVTENRDRLRRGEVLAPAQAEAAVGAFLRSWARLVEEERPALLSLLADLRHFPDLAARLLATVRDQIDDLARTLGTDSRRYREFDARVTTRVSVAAATLAGLLADEDSDRFVNEYVNVLMRGVLRS